MKFDLMEFLKIYGGDIAILLIVLIGFFALILIYLDTQEAKSRKEFNRKYARGEL